MLIWFIQSGVASIHQGAHGCLKTLPFSFLSQNFMWCFITKFYVVVGWQSKISGEEEGKTYFISQLMTNLKEMTMKSWFQRCKTLTHSV